MTFEAKWQWTFDDYQVLNGAYAKLTSGRRARRWLLPALVVIVSMFGAYLFWSGDSVGGWFTVLYVVLLLALRFLLTPWAQKRRYKQQNLDGEAIVLQADDAGVRIHTSKSDTNSTWQGFPQVTILEGHTILWQNLILGIAIPDRAFASLEDARRFADFAKEKTNGKTL